MLERMNMKKGLIVFATLMSLLLVMGKVAGRKDSADQIWERSMEGEPTPEAIKGVLVQDSSDEKEEFAKDFDTKGSAIIYHSRFAKAFETKPSVIIYHGADANKA